MKPTDFTHLNIDEPTPSEEIDAPMLYQDDFDAIVNLRKELMAISHRYVTERDIMRNNAQIDILKYMLSCFQIRKEK